MAIEKYPTKCIVIETFEHGEHDRVYKLFTREFGMIFARATSVRKLESKLRAHLLPRTRSLVTLVQGREVWRLVGAEHEDRISLKSPDIVILLNRLVRGEGAHKALYDRLVQFLESTGKYDEQKARLLVYYILLVELGYADARVIGTKSIDEYISFTVDDLYTHLLLSESSVKSHVQAVLKELQM
jgi:recombinational DNA repair protein (RecF pathway)